MMDEKRRNQKLKLIQGIRAAQKLLNEVLHEKQIDVGDEGILNFAVENTKDCDTPCIIILQNNINDNEVLTEYTVSQNPPKQSWQNWYIFSSAAKAEIWIQKNIKWALWKHYYIIPGYILKEVK